MTQEQEPANSINEVMARMPTVFQPNKAAGATATIQFNFTGAEPGSWVIRIADGRCEVSEGVTDKPSVTINSPSEVWLKISRQEMDGATAFITGKFTFKGDMGVLMKMPGWFGQG
jgi:putative sterol carrier protein